MKNFLTITFLFIAGLAFAQPVRTTITDDGMNVTVQTPVNVKVIPICDFHWVFVDGQLKMWIEGGNELIPGGRLGNFTVNGAATQQAKLAALGVISAKCSLGSGLDSLYNFDGTLLAGGDTILGDGNGIYDGGGTVPDGTELTVSNSIIKYSSTGAPAIEIIDPSIILYSGDGSSRISIEDGALSVIQDGIGSLSVTTNGIRIVDDRIGSSRKGLEANADYSASYSDLSYVTKGYVNNGTYTPTLFNTTNVAASTAYVCQWSKVGPVVTVSGAVDIDATLAAGTNTILGMSLPVASNFTNRSNCGGTAASDAAVGLSAPIKGDTGNDRALIQFLSSSLTNDTYSFTFTYLIL